MRFSVIAGVAALATLLPSLAGAVSSTDEYQDAVCHFVEGSPIEDQNSLVLGYRPVGLHAQP
jgi:hypothetical protein